MNTEDSTAVPASEAIKPNEPIIISVAGLRKVAEYKHAALKLMAEAQDKPDFRATVRLVPEPSNIHDSKAVKVVINDAMVGYVPRSEQSYLEQRHPKVFQGHYALIKRWGATEDGPFIELVISD